MKKLAVAFCLFFLLFGAASLGYAGDVWLDTVVLFDQPSGSSNDGGPPEAALGPADDDWVSIDIPEIAVFAFTDNTAIDGPGNDLHIYEVVNGDSSVLIYASKNNRDYTLLGKANGDVEYDLADYELDSVVFLKFIGLDNEGNFQGFDLDAVEALNSGSAPECFLELGLSFAENALTLDFYVGTSGAVTWSVWLFFLNQTIPLWSIPLPAIESPVSVSIPIPGFPNLGSVGVLTALTTLEGGIICSDWETVDTGPIPPGAAAPTEEELRRLF